MTSKIYNFILQAIFLSLKFVELSYDLADVSIISSHVTSESPMILLKYLPISQAHVLGFQTYSFSHTYFIGFLHSHRHNSLFHFLFELHFLLSNLHLQSHEICFVIVFDSFILVILKTCKFTSSFNHSTYSTRQIIKSISTSITSIRTNHKWLATQSLIMFIWI